MNTIQKYAVSALGYTLAGKNWPAAIDCVFTLAHDPTLTGRQKFDQVVQMLIDAGVTGLQIVAELVVTLALNYALNGGKIVLKDGKLIAGD